VALQSEDDTASPPGEILSITVY